MRNLTIIGIIVIVIVVGTIGCIELSGIRYIIDTDGTRYEPTVDNLQIALDKGGNIKLPIGTIDIDKYINITNLDGITFEGYGSWLTTLNFPDHYTYEGPGTNVGQSGMVTKGLKRIYFEDCSDLTIKGIKFTGAAKLDVQVIKDYHFEDLVFEDIDRPYIHHREPGGRAMVFWLYIPDYRDLAENFVFKDIHIARTTISSIFLATHQPYSTYRNVTFEDCSLRHIGTEVNGYPLVNNWSAGFHTPEMHYHPDYEMSPAIAENFLFKNCIAEYCWEAGFHSEGRCIEKGVKFINCKANYNGQKDFTYGAPIAQHACGFFNFKDGVEFINCEAIGNSRHGIQASGNATIVGGTFNDNILSGIRAYGWKPKGQSLINIRDVICNNNKEHGLSIRYYYLGGTLDNCEAKGNSINGILLHRLFNVEVKNSKITNNPIGIDEGDASDNNNIYNNYLCNSINYQTTATSTTYENNEEC